MKKVAVVLSGCGVMDGAEIHEATCTLLYLDQAGAEVQCYAPDKPQMHVVDHLKNEPSGESRNVMAEAARISRGSIKPLSELKMADFDAVVFPGGYGAAKNLCTFATEGADCTVDADVSRIVKDAVERSKVVGAMCIAPAAVAKALSDTGLNPKLTVGEDQGTMDALKAMNSNAQPAKTTEIVIDDKNKIVSTPAYMMGTRISEVAEGIEKLVKKVVEMA
jgi:enhancing lycopene biosynthesis protein 2